MKCMIVVICAIILAVTAKEISLADMLKAYEETNEIGSDTPVANQALYITMSVKECSIAICNIICQNRGFVHGTCDRYGECHCYN